MITTREVAEWIKAEGLATQELWSNEDFEKISKRFGGEIIATGGGIDVILVTLENGDVIGIGEESACLYHKNPEDKDAYDTFWNENGCDDAHTVSLIE